MESSLVTHKPPRSLIAPQSENAVDSSVRRGFSGLVSHCRTPPRTCWMGQPAGDPPFGISIRNRFRWSPPGGSGGSWGSASPAARATPKSWGEADSTEQGGGPARAGVPVSVSEGRRYGTPKPQVPRRAGWTGKQVTAGRECGRPGRLPEDWVPGPARCRGARLPCWGPPLGETGKGPGKRGRWPEPGAALLPTAWAPRGRAEGGSGRAKAGAHF